MTESLTRGYRTNRAAEVRLEETRRRLSDQLKSSPRKKPPGSVPISTYASMRQHSRNQKRFANADELTDDIGWMIRAQEVLKNRGNPTAYEKRAYEQAEELARLQRAVHSKKTLKEKLDRISSEIAALTGNILKSDDHLKPEDSIDDENTN